MSNVIDINTGKLAENIEIDSDIPIKNYFDFWKKLSKEKKIQSVLLIAVCEDTGLLYDIRNFDRQHLLQLYVECDRIKEEIYDLIYPPLELDAEEDEPE